MIRIGILGDIGSGKTYIANNFGYPVFSADKEVAKLYKKNKTIFKKLRKILPQYFHTFPIEKVTVVKTILSKPNNLKKIIKIIHYEIRKKLNIFLKKNKDRKIVILDIPLLLENRLNKKNDVLIYVASKKTDILKNLKKRPNFNNKLFKRFREIQLPLEFKKKKSSFIIKNNFTKKKN